MTHGKNICNQLKEVRKRIAEENEIPLEIEECSYKGECRGTCPRCEAEVRYLENVLADRLHMGKVATVAGIVLALSGSAAAQGTNGVRISCPDIQKMMPTIDTTVGREMAILRGTVIDGKTKEPLPFCNIIVKQGGKTVGGASTNFDGAFSLRLPLGVYDISTSSIGYTTHLWMGVQLKEDMDEPIVLERSAADSTLTQQADSAGHEKIRHLEYTPSLISSDAPEAILSTERLRRGRPLPGEVIAEIQVILGGTPACYNGSEYGDHPRFYEEKKEDEVKVIVR